MLSFLWNGQAAQHGAHRERPIAVPSRTAASSSRCCRGGGGHITGPEPGEPAARAAGSDGRRALGSGPVPARPEPSPEPVHGRRRWATLVLGALESAASWTLVPALLLPPASVSPNSAPGGLHLLSAPPLPPQPPPRHVSGLLPCSASAAAPQHPGHRKLRKRPDLCDPRPWGRSGGRVGDRREWAQGVAGRGACSGLLRPLAPLPPGLPGDALLGPWAPPGAAEGGGRRSSRLPGRRGAALGGADAGRRRRKRPSSRAGGAQSLCCLRPSPQGEPARRRIAKRLLPSGGSARQQWRSAGRLARATAQDHLHRRPRMPPPDSPATARSTVHGPPQAQGGPSLEEAALSSGKCLAQFLKRSPRRV